MNTDRLNSCSLDELWKLHEEVASKLAQKLTAEKARLDERLRKLGRLTKPLEAGISCLRAILRRVISQVCRERWPMRIFLFFNVRAAGLFQNRIMGAHLF